MSHFLITYLIAIIVFFAIDILWLAKIAQKLYQKEIGSLLLKKPKWSAAIVFYLLYLIGIVVFGILPATSALEAWGLGALFGLIAYATYDLTNLATLKGFSLKITIIDLIWGTFITSTTSVLAYLIVSLL